MAQIPLRGVSAARGARSGAGRLAGCASLLLSVVLLSMPLTASAAVIHVRGGGVGDGTSWLSPYGTLQEALDDAAAGDTILVSAGTYKPTSDYGRGVGDRGKHFRLKDGVGVFGGFPAAGSPGWAERDPDAHPTVLSGDLDGGGTVSSGDAYHVFFHMAPLVGATAVLDGCTVSGGNADSTDGPDHAGGGMANYGCSPTLVNCIFRGNAAGSYGGGMYNSQGNLAITGCRFEDNSAPTGGGMYNSTSNPVLIDCVFSGNRAVSGRGAGMYNQMSGPSLTECMFDGNVAAGDGGGVYSESGSNPVFVRCMFRGNTGADGGGVKFQQGQGTVTDCVFDGNGAAAAGGGAMSYYAAVTFTGCMFGGNDAAFGGGASNSGGTVTYADCVFTGNSAPSGGGGLRNLQSDAVVTSCTFTANSADGDGGGGGISNGLSSPTIVNCVLTGNTAKTGGAMLNSSGAPTAANCTIAGNYAITLGGGVHTLSGSTPAMSNCVVWGNTASAGGNQFSITASTVALSYCCYANGAGDISGTGLSADNCIVTDPLFAAPAAATSTPTADGNYRLLYGSPAIDAGSDAVVSATADRDGGPRVVDGDGDGTAHVDMGAYERRPGDINTDGGLDVADAVLCMRMAAGFDPFSAAGDLDGSGTVDIRDVMLLLAGVLGLS